MCESEAAKRDEARARGPIVRKIRVSRAMTCRGYVARASCNWLVYRTRLAAGASHYHVSRLLNFFVTTLPMSMPSRSTIRWARSGCEVPLKTLMFGILLCRPRTREFSKFARNKLLARTGCDTGITETESTGTLGQSLLAARYRT